MAKTERPQETNGPLWSDTEGVPLVSGRPAPSTPAAEGVGLQGPPPTSPADAPTEVIEPPPPPKEASSPATAPTLAEGIDLIGEYEDSGYKEPHYIARRADGQVIQLSELLYLVAKEMDGQRSYEEIATRVSEGFGKQVSADNVETLVNDQLRKLGVATAADGSNPEVEKADPMLALRFKTAVIPEGVTKAITILFKPLFWPPIVLAVVAAFLAVDVWLFFMHGVAQSVREMIYQPGLLLMILGLVVVATAFHECGHATACAYGGAKPGVMGAGIYIVWPAFYTDVTDAYRLNRAGRLRTDLGGVYFNSIFALITFGVYLLTGFEPLLLIVMLQNFVVIQQMLPLLRMDGYYILADLTGVPDLFMRIRPTLASLIPWKKTPESVKELKPWVRVVVTMWVLILVPFLIYVFGTILLSAPRIFATAWDSGKELYGKAADAFGEGDTVKGLSSGAQMLALGLPLAGICLTALRTGKKTAVGLWNWTGGKPFGRALAGLAIAGGIVAAGFALGPGGDYTPITPDDRGVFQDSVGAFRSSPHQVDELIGGDPQDEPAPAPAPSSSEEAEARTGSGTTQEQQPATEEEEVEPTPSPTPTT